MRPPSTFALLLALALGAQSQQILGTMFNIEINMEIVNIVDPKKKITIANIVSGAELGFQETVVGEIAFTPSDSPAASFTGISGGTITETSAMGAMSAGLFDVLEVGFSTEFTHKLLETELRWGGLRFSEEEKALPRSWAPTLFAKVSLPYRLRRDGKFVISGPVKITDVDAQPGTEVRWGNRGNGKDYSKVGGYEAKVTALRVKPRQIQPPKT